MKKKMLSIVLALCMMLSVMPMIGIMASAEISPVCFVGETNNVSSQYASLAEALATKPEQLTLLTDVNANIVVEEDQELLLDLNGYFLEAATSGSVIENYGKLSIEDNKAPKRNVSLYLLDGVVINQSKQVVVDQAKQGTVDQAQPYDSVEDYVLSGAISGGDATNGGGIYNEGELNICGGSVFNNKATNGAGIYNNGSLVIDGCYIFRNSAASCGGGIYNAADASVVINGVEMTKNTSPDGGAVYTEGTVEVYNGAFHDNTSDTGRAMSIKGNADVTLDGDTIAIYENAGVLANNGNYAIAVYGEDAKLTLGDGVEFYDNGSDTAKNGLDLFLNYDASPIYFTAGGLDDSVHIGVNTNYYCAYNKAVLQITQNDTGDTTDHFYLSCADDVRSIAYNEDKDCVELQTTYNIFKDADVRASLTLNEKIALNLTVELGEDDTYEGSTEVSVLTNLDSDGNVTDSFETTVPLVDGKYTLYDFDPVELDKELKFVVVLSGIEYIDNNDYKYAVSTGVATYNPMIYCEAVKKIYKDSTDNKKKNLVALCSALENYGAYCQREFLEEADWTIDTADFVNEIDGTYSNDYRSDVKNQEGSLPFTISANLNLESATKIRFVIHPDGDMTLSTFKSSFNVILDKSFLGKTFADEDITLKVNEEDDTIYFDTDGISSSNLSAFWSLTVSDKGSNQITYYYSPMCYVYANIGNNLARALYDYSVCACAYFGTEFGGKVIS